MRNSELKGSLLFGKAEKKGAYFSFTTSFCTVGSCLVRVKLFYFNYAPATYFGISAVALRSSNALYSAIAKRV